MEELNAKNFDERVGANRVTLVDFYADWCGPCKMMAPVMEEVAAELAGTAFVAKVNVDAEPELAARFKVFSIPTFVVLKDGAEAERMVGAVGKTGLVEKVKAHL